MQSSFTPDSSEIFFTSYRSGSPELEIAQYPEGATRQLTHNASIHPYSPALHPEGRRDGTGLECLYEHGNDEYRGIDATTGALTPVCLTESSNQGSQREKSSYASDRTGDTQVYVVELS